MYVFFEFFISICLCIEKLDVHLLVEVLFQLISIL
jgi:hypothetical protein